MNLNQKLIQLLLITQARRETQSELTCLEFINFWLCSIYAHAVPPSSDTGKNVNETAQKSPQIFIVGTHREDVKGHRREKWKKVTTKVLQLYTEKLEKMREMYTPR